MLSRNPSIEFAGYAIPHPSEPHLNIRVQTNGTKLAVDAFNESLDNLVGTYDHVHHAWLDEVARFKKEGPKK